MKFAVDFDPGDCIHGWLVLDNPNETPTILICLPEREPIELRANVHRQDLLDGGWHGTGMAGFRVDEKIVPTLQQENEIELRESVSRLLIYKRYSINRHIDKKLLFMDACVFPQKGLHAALNPHFTMPFNFVERYSHETLEAIIAAPHGKSVLLGGRPRYARHAQLLRERGFLAAALLRDPFEELAERLLFLDLMGRSEQAGALLTLAADLAPLAGFARGLPFNDSRALERAFRGLTSADKKLLRDPMTKMLAGAGDERATRVQVTQALENLASMDVVGTRARFFDFRPMLAAALGADVFAGASPETRPAVVEAAAHLARAGAARDLLEQDLALYSYVEEALESGLSQGQQRRAG